MEVSTTFLRLRFSVFNSFSFKDERSPQLPYLTQDLWTCDRKLQDIDAWTLESEDLKVVVTPAFAGKVWTIYDKKRGSDILFNNRAHQPANIGALKSWFVPFSHLCM